MKKPLSLVAIGLCLALSACSPSVTTETPIQVPSSASPPPTATPTPTQSAMSLEVAGKYYLDAVCKANAASDKANSTVQAQPFDLAGSQRDVALLRDAYRQVVDSLSSKDAHWPEDAKTSVDAFVEAMYNDVSRAATVASATTKEDFLRQWNNWTAADETDPALAAAQKVRAKLGLSADAVGSCAK